MSTTFTDAYVFSILDNWNISKSLRSSKHQGLINHTWLVGDPVEGVLQWVNPIFNENIHLDIEAVTSHLLSKGLQTTSLISTHNGTGYVADPNGGFWRILRYIPGQTFDTVQSTKHAFAAGKLVGEFHNAMSDFEYTWQAPYRDSHNTVQKMALLEDTLHSADGHNLEVPVRALGNQILREWAEWSGQLNLPKRSCHGDLKISNLHFKNLEQGICLLDLDTLGPGDYSIEMGDAWRSWCNPAGESNLEQTYFDLSLFEASANGWLTEMHSITAEEKNNLISGVERICLELSARFCADAIQNTYFKENRSLFPEIGQHNLQRARTQFKLAQSVNAQKSQAEKIIRTI